MVALSILLHNKLGKGWFGDLSWHFIGWPVSVLTNQFASKKYDLLAKKTAKPVFVWFPRPKFYWIGQAGLIAAQICYLA